jgi:hypothetical protein
VTNFYKPPIKYNRSESEEEIFQKRAKANKSMTMSAEKKKPEDKTVEKDIIDLENLKFNEKAEDIRYARDRI